MRRRRRLSRGRRASLDFRIVTARRLSRATACPWSAPRKIASWREPLSPSESNFGIGEPGFTQDGHLRCRIWKSMPRFCVPISLRSGAPRFDDPEPRYVWQEVQPDDGEEHRARYRRSAAGSPPSPTRHVRDHLRGERLLRGRTLPCEHRHRDDDEHRGDHGDRTARQPPLARACRRTAARSEDHEQRSSARRPCRGTPTPAT